MKHTQLIMNDDGRPVFVVLTIPKFIEFLRKRHAGGVNDDRHDSKIFEYRIFSIQLLNN